MIRRSLRGPLAAVAFAVVVAASLAGLHGQVAAPSLAFDNNDIAGVVTGPSGPEAGVWVIAETKDLPTTLRKIVVTDNQGRYLVPDLPAANYDVWVRGYGLVDSAKVKSAPGKVVNLKAVVAPTPRQAAEYYPAQYWLSLLQLPPKSDFPGTGAKGNGISETIKSQGEWIRQIVNTDGAWPAINKGKERARSLRPGQVENRSLPGSADSVRASWRRMSAHPRRSAGSERWPCSRTGRIGLPPASCRQWPPRPSKVERNVVVTMWTGPIQRLISTTRFRPTNGIQRSMRTDRSMAAEASADYLPVGSDAPCLESGKAAGSRSQDAERSVHSAGGGIAVLEGRSHLDEPVERPQLRDGQAEPRMDRRAHPSKSDAGLLSARFESSVRPGVSTGTERPADAAVRSQNEAGYDD